MKNLQEYIIIAIIITFCLLLILSCIGLVKLTDSSGILIGILAIVLLFAFLDL